MADKLNIQVCMWSELHFNSWECGLRNLNSINEAEAIDICNSCANFLNTEPSDD